MGGAFVLPAHDGIAHGGLEGVSGLDAANRQQPAWHRVLAPYAGVTGQALFIGVVEIGCGVDEPILVGIFGADVELIADADLVLVGSAIVKLIEYGRHTRAGVAGDDDDILGIGSRQGIRAIIGGISAGLIHGVRVDGAIEHAAIVIVELRMNIDGGNEHLYRGGWLNDGGLFRRDLVGLQAFWRADAAIDGADDQQCYHDARRDTEDPGRLPGIFHAIPSGRLLPVPRQRGLLEAAVGVAALDAARVVFGLPPIAIVGAVPAGAPGLGSFGIAGRWPGARAAGPAGIGRSGSVAFWCRRVARVRRRTLGPLPPWPVLVVHATSEENRDNRGGCEPSL